MLVSVSHRNDWQWSTRPTMIMMMLSVDRDKLRLCESFYHLHGTLNEQTLKDKSISISNTKSLKLSIVDKGKQTRAYGYLTVCLPTYARLRLLMSARATFLHMHTCTSEEKIILFIDCSSFFFLSCKYSSVVNRHIPLMVQTVNGTHECSTFQRNRGLNEIKCVRVWMRQRRKQRISCCSDPTKCQQPEHTGK